ncbi:NAD(P)-dependent oxidoreductase [Actinomadura sp. KC216]|uniref:NAD(P)-dependent oxidoreductase n=1 Tax=Actinomadura sp. KC216 TaxID=2530370 RepID=UPI001052F44B|nr:NAD(P)-dependent oxidoreductase [Actinomadura sp. KC216]TDB91385.1 NAD(P)-dependent oxidoreductase [Actinomadura sp. KC216]
MSTIAVIGLGAMGSRIAGRLLRRGHKVRIWNRGPRDFADLRGAGAQWCQSPAAAADGAEGVVLMVSDGAALRAVSEGPEGVFAAGGTPLLIQMSTVSPADLRAFAETAPDPARVMDAPVLGSVAEAENGSLQVLVGSASELFGVWEPFLRDLGTPTHLGPYGSGTAAKLVANSSLFGVLCVLGESMRLAEGLGLDTDATYRLLALTPLAAQAERRRPALEAGDFPARFVLELALKDCGLAAAAAAAAGLDVRLLPATRTWLEDAGRDGWAGRDYTAVLARIKGDEPPA